MLGAISGSIKALVIHDDNPILNSPDTDTILSALSNLESLVVIDSVKSTLSEYATVMLSEAAFYHRSGSITTADRRVLLHNSIDIGVEKEKSGIEIIKRIAAGLGFELDRVFSYSSLAEYPSEVSVVQQQGHSRAIPDQSEMKASVQDIDLPLMERVDNLAVFTSRSLYTSWDGASSASEEADKLDREGTAWVNPADALDAGVTSGAVVTLQNGSHSITMKVKLDDGVAAGTVYVPSYYRGGAIMSLFDFEGLAGGLPSVKLIAADA
jgi:predicted molibdopterin-dependent oxidoreductase YjgC